MNKVTVTLAALAVLVCLGLVACRSGDTGLSRAEVQEIVRAELADAPAPHGLTAADVKEAIRRALAEMPRTEAGLSKGEVDRVVQAAVAAIPTPQPGLTSAEAEGIAQGVVASIPARSAPAEYTRFFVDNAISRYETQGLDAALAYYNRADSVDAQWYVFVATLEGEILGHYNAEDFAVHLQEMLDDGSFQATEEGVWVNHEDANPATGEIEDKHFWLVAHDGLVFGSGWHHDALGG